MRQPQNRPTRWQTSFFTIWTGQAFSILGSMLVHFALVWWLTEKTGSATVLTIGTLLGLLPGIVLGPIVGTLVDRWNRRLVMIVADGLIALATIWLAYLFVAEAVQVGHIYAILFIRALGGGFHWPAMQASTSLMVPEEQLSRVAGLNQALRGFMNILAPPFGAFLMEILPLQTVLAIDVGTAALAIAPLFFVHIPQPERRPAASGAGGSSEESKSSVWGELLEGLRYVWNWPALLTVIVLGALGNLLINPAFSLVPLLVTDHFGGQALELGWMEAAGGIGVVAGGLILSAWGGFRRRLLTSLMGFIGVGVGILGMGMASSSAYWMAVGSIFVVGVAVSMTDGPLMALIQAEVAPEMQGRVFMLLVSAVKIASPLSLVIAGPVSDWLGIRLWYFVAGLGCVLMGAGAFFVPALAKMEDNPNDRAVVGGTALEPGPVPVHVEVV